MKGKKRQQCCPHSEHQTVYSFESDSGLLNTLRRCNTCACVGEIYSRSVYKQNKSLRKFRKRANNSISVNTGVANTPGIGLRNTTYNINFYGGNSLYVDRPLPYRMNYGAIYGGGNFIINPQPVEE